jgi:hypothetical protein
MSITMNAKTENNGIAFIGLCPLGEFYAPARARWRLRFAFRLALRLLALIVLLDLLVCFISSSALFSDTQARPFRHARPCAGHPRKRQGVGISS